MELRELTTEETIKFDYPGYFSSGEKPLICKIENKLGVSIHVIASQDKNRDREGKPYGDCAQIGIFKEIDNQPNLTAYIIERNSSYEKLIENTSRFLKEYSDVLINNDYDSIIALLDSKGFELYIQI